MMLKVVYLEYLFKFESRFAKFGLLTVKTHIQKRYSFLEDMIPPTTQSNADNMEDVNTIFGFSETKAQSDQLSVRHPSYVRVHDWGLIRLEVWHKTKESFDSFRNHLNYVVSYVVILLFENNSCTT